MGNGTNGADRFTESAFFKIAMPALIAAIGVLAVREMDAANDTLDKVVTKVDALAIDMATMKGSNGAIKAEISINRERIEVLEDAVKQVTKSCQK